MNECPWLETDEEFEGVGAHADNPRYDPVDEDVCDENCELDHAHTR